MPDPSVRKITDTKFVQKAEIVFSLGDLRKITPQAYTDAVGILTDLREEALRVLEVDENNADVTAVDFAVKDGNAIVTVTQVNT